MARPLFQVFRDCCLVCLSSDNCSFGVAAGCLHLQRVWAYGTASFSSVPRLLLGLGLWHGLLFCSVPRLLLDPPQKLRCSSHSPLLRQLFFWRRRWLSPSPARLGLWHGLFFKCSETAACSGPVARPPFL